MSKPNNQDNPNTVEFWEALGIKPIVVDTSSDKDVENKAADIAERIKDAAKEIRGEKND